MWQHDAFSSKRIRLLERIWNLLEHSFEYDRHPQLQ